LPRATHSTPTQQQHNHNQAAQLAKLDAVIAAAGLTATDHVLEIGCGWGSFAMRAASMTGCRVTGLTLSKEQLAEATARVAAAGLGDRVTLLFCDYRCVCLGCAASFRA
jgi:cyclopropane-fatty-acyl-phospholipid synthase